MFSFLSPTNNSCEEYFALLDTERDYILCCIITYLYIYVGFMKGNWLLRKGMFRFLILNLLIAIAYAIGVDLSEKFATLPGGVTSVWFPSGLTLALVYLLGNRVLLGIAGGSILAISLTLLKIDPPISIFNFLLINAGCALGNCLQPRVISF